MSREFFASSLGVVWVLMQSVAGQRMVDGYMISNLSFF